jgi:hypothetical protein
MVRLKGYPNYSIDCSGKVYSHTRDIYLKQCLSNKGYPVVYLRANGESHTLPVHRLVALTFLPGDSTLTVNHINCDKTDNRVENLEWLSRGDNNALDKQKDYLLYDPDGDTVLVRNLRQFCASVSLNYKSMHNAMTKDSEYLGWQCFKYS